MAQNASDSSDDDDASFTTTNVMLGYASTEPTDDSFSQLGGYPIWPPETDAPSAELAKCKVCNNMMTLLLQLNGDLPEKFPGHERKLYIFSCKRRACRKKEGTCRAIRGIRILKGSTQKSKAIESTSTVKQDSKQKQPPQDLGNNLFNSTLSSSNFSSQNPFSTSTTSQPPSTNPFASQPISTPPKPFPLPPIQPPEPSASSLPATFAQKARISSPPPLPPTKIPWPPQSDLPHPYPSYHLDADYETLDPTPPSPSPKTAMDIDTEGAGSKDDDEKDAFESTIDKTFQRFADRLAQNPEQVLRYEFGGTPLLYSKTDTVGKLFSNPHQQQQPASGNAKITTTTTTIHSGVNMNRIPRCQNCSAPRVFECQLVPHAIAQLEVEEEGMEGMEWGTVILGVCERDCGERGVKEGEMGWVEEWVGVQWEEEGGKEGRG